MFSSSVCLNLRDGWMAAADPQNRGLDEQWYINGFPETAAEVEIPSFAHSCFPNEYLSDNAQHIIWYYLPFFPTYEKENAKDSILRFESADFWCDIYLNGIYVGHHRGAKESFDVNISNEISFENINELYVRVSKPHNSEMNGLCLAQIPNRKYTSEPYSTFGLYGDVLLMSLPRIRLSEVYVYGDLTTYSIAVIADVWNGTKKSKKITLSAEAVDPKNGFALCRESYSFEADPGDNSFCFNLSLDFLRFWNNDDPFMYTVNVSLESHYKKADYLHTLSRRTGFRYLRIEENGSLCMNGEEFIPNCADIDITSFSVYDTRRRLESAKFSGHNCVRFIGGYLSPEILNYCDELGMLVIRSHASADLLQDSDMLEELYLDDLFSMIIRERSHPSIVMWELFGSKPEGMVFDVANFCLPKLRELDNTRPVLFSDAILTNKEDGLPLFANPGESDWNILY